MLDKLDRKLLVELDINSRRSFSQIAKKLKTSKNVVAYRVNRLIKQNIILGFYTVINTIKLGYNNYRIYLRFKNCDVEKRDEIIQSFINEESTWWVARTTYPWDLVVILLAKSPIEANLKFQNVTKPVLKYIKTYKINPYIKLIHFSKDYFVKHEGIHQRQTFSLGGNEIITINDLEKQLLHILSLNARIGTVQIAKKLNTTPMVVKYAIKKLVKNNIILGFRVLINYEKVKYNYYWIHIQTSSNYDNLSKFVKSLPNTVYFDETLGGDALEFAVHLSSEDNIHYFIQKLIKKYGRIIDDYYYFQVIKNEKVLYMPRK